MGTGIIITPTAGTTTITAQEVTSLVQTRTKTGETLPLTVHLSSTKFLLANSSSMVSTGPQHIATPSNIKTNTKAPIGSNLLTTAPILCSNSKDPTWLPNRNIPPGMQKTLCKPLTNG